MAPYRFTDTGAAQQAAARAAVRALADSGRLPTMATLETLPEPFRSAILDDIGALAGIVAPIIAWDVFLEVRSAMQKIAWGDEMTDDQKEMWGRMSTELGRLGAAITEGGKP